jgi:hypothetical protein
MSTVGSNRPTPAEGAARPAENELADPERLAYRWDDLPRVLEVPRRTLERAVRARTFPRPNRRLGRVCLWSRESLERWLATGNGRA